MHPTALFFFALVSLESVAAFSTPISARRRSTSVTRLGRRGNIFGHTALSNNSDFSYYTNITLNGQSFEVLVDTGSSDLWVSGTVPNAKDTGFTAGVTYAVGSVSGRVMAADLEFAGYKVTDQAFLLATPSSSNPSSTGLIGLGPNNGSSIFSAANELAAEDAPLDRIFRQNTSTPNFMSVLLGRNDDVTDDLPGDLTIGTYLSGFEAIQNEPKLPVTEVDDLQFRNQHWSVLLDKNGIIGPNGKAITTTSTVTNTTTPNQLDVIFDTGFSIPQVPKAVADAIYGAVSGAKLQNVKGVGDIYVLPCTTELNVTLMFGGKPIRIHPLDVVLDVGMSENRCVGGFQPMSTGTSGLFDAILGMAFLRNAYLLINFGDFVDDATTTADPFVQLLSVTNNTAEMHKDFVKVRKSLIDTGETWVQKHRFLILGVALGALLVIVMLVLLRGRLQSRSKASSSWKPASAGTYIPLGAPAPPGTSDYPQYTTSSGPPFGSHLRSFSATAPYDPPAGPPPPAPHAPYDPPLGSDPFAGPPPAAPSYAPPSGPPPSAPPVPTLAYVPPQGPPPSHLNAQSSYSDPFRNNAR